MAKRTDKTPDQALWVGYAGATLYDGTELVPGVTICEIPLAEAEASDHWQPVTVKKVPAKPRAKKAAKVVPSESAGTQEGAGAPSEPAAAPAADGSAD